MSSVWLTSPGQHSRSVPVSFSGSLHPCSVGEAAQQGGGQALAAEDLGPIGEAEVGGDDRVGQPFQWQDQGARGKEMRRPDVASWEEIWW